MLLLKADMSLWAYPTIILGRPTHPMSPWAYLTSLVGKPTHLMATRKITTRELPWLLKSITTITTIVQLIGHQTCMNQQNIMGALVYGLLAYQPAPATVAPVPEGAPVVVYICNFLFSDYIKEDDIKDFTCHTLMEGRLVGYSCTTNGDGAPQVHSLLNMTPFLALIHNYFLQARIAGLPLHIKTQNLPPGYTHQQPNPTAQRMNIADSSFHKVNGPAPCLEVLCNIVSQPHLHQSVPFSVTSLPTTGSTSPSVNWRTLPLASKVQFAYTRLDTALKAGQVTQGHGSQWTPIDTQLLFFKPARHGLPPRLIPTDHSSSLVTQLVSFSYEEG
ncbi:hypothetical protein MJO28_001747 [Puccinia striiformis f. sp. tritici]|uniref:Uncharacterized protein n=1 Tax=Puccinia striiformis f. sp. tritici TaxID=168172 RepID=A0ACC0EUE5_9BASI|nr:hypothetical protein MJO28_001747 [Puccinia striiformis f. sp. tritici]